MNRTFHQHFSLHALAAIALLAAVALWCFLVRSGLSPVVGLVCMLVGAAAVDRLVNTTYTFTPDDTLVIARGRLGRRTTVPVGEIVAVRRIRATLFTAAHIVIEYGAGRITYAQPSQPSAFIGEIRRRQEKCDGEWEHK